MKPRLYEKYLNDVRPKLIGDGKFKNIHQVPGISKIVINMGVSGMMEKGALEHAAADLTTLPGANP